MQFTSNGDNRKNGADAPAPESGAPGADPSALAHVQPGPSDAEYESVTPRTGGRATPVPACSSVRGGGAN